MPDSQQTYKGRRSQVATIHLLYKQVDKITQPLGPRTPYKHALERLRRICFLALSMQVLKYNRKAFKGEAPKDLEAYNYGVCYSWLMQYYEDEPATLSRSQVRLVWKQDPT